MVRTVKVTADICIVAGRSAPGPQLDFAPIIEAVLKELDTMGEGTMDQPSLVTLSVSGRNYHVTWQLEDPIL